MVTSDRDARVRQATRRRSGRVGPVGGAVRRGVHGAPRWPFAVACALALQASSTLALAAFAPPAYAPPAYAPPTFAQGAYLDPPHAEPGLGGFAAQVEFGPAEVPPVAAATASPHGGAWFATYRPDFAVEPPWTTVVVVGTNDGALWRLTLRDHANVDVRVVWVTERLLLVEVWWGRTVLSELWVDAWRAELVHATTYAWYGAASGDDAPP